MPKVETSQHPWGNIFLNKSSQNYVSKIVGIKTRSKRDAEQKAPHQRVVKKLIRIEPIYKQKHVDSNINFYHPNDYNKLKLNSYNNNSNVRFVDNSNEYLGQPSDIPKNYHRKRVIVKKKRKKIKKDQIEYSAQTSNNRKKIIVTKKRIIKMSSADNFNKIKPTKRVRIKKIKHTINPISENFSLDDKVASLSSSENKILIDETTSGIGAILWGENATYRSYIEDEEYDVEDNIEDSLCDGYTCYEDDKDVLSTTNEGFYNEEVTETTDLINDTEVHTMASFNDVATEDSIISFDKDNLETINFTVSEETTTIETIVSDEAVINQTSAKIKLNITEEDEDTENYNKINYSSKDLPDYEPFFPEISFDAPILLLKTTVLSSIENVVKTVVQSKLRTYTFVVTRVSGDEQIVTSATEIKPHTKTILVTEPITKYTTITFIDSSETLPLIPMTVNPSMESSNQPNTQEARALDEARYNLATRIMSNGVEVIVAGDKTTYPGEPDVKRVLPSTIYKPITLKPSTLTNNMMMLLPQEASKIESLSSSLYPNQFVTKTCLTTFTYLTTYLENGTTAVSSHEQVVSNVATEERNTGKILPTPTMGITLTQYPNLAVGTFVTTYTYLNTILDGEQPLVVTSKKLVTNTVTAPDDYLLLLQSKENAVPVKDTNTYFSTISLQKTLFEGKVSKVVSTNEVVTQVVITESIPPKGTSIMTSYFAMDNEDKNPSTYSTTDVTKTYFVTYTYYDTIIDGDKTSIISNVSTSSDVVTEKLFLQPKKSKGSNKSVINTSPINKDAKKKNKNEENSEIKVHAIKTYYTTFTYFTTLLQDDKDTTNTIISSHSRVVENIVTESINIANLNKKFINSIKKEIKESGEVTRLATLNDGLKIDITAIFKEKIQPTKVLPIEKTQIPEQIKATPDIESSSPNIITGSTIVFVDELDDPFALNTENTPILSKISKTQSKNALSSLLSSEIIKKPQLSASKRKNLTKKNKATIIPSKPISQNQISTKLGDKKTEKVVKPVGGVTNLLNSINIQALTPVLNAMAGLIQTNLKANKRNETITSTTPRVSSKVEEVIDVQNRSPIYIPVGGLSDIETAESENIANVWSDDENSQGSPLLQGGIPISPGDVITANSDVIVGKPGRIGPRIPAIPLKYPDTTPEEIPFGMKPPPVPNKTWLKRHSDSQNVALQPTFHAPSADDYIGPPPKLPARPKNAVRVDKYPNNNNRHIIINSGENFPNVIPINKFEDFKNKEFITETQGDLIVAPNLKLQPSLIKEHHILPEVIDRSTGQPLLVNIQPSQIAFVNIPHNQTNALIYGGSTEPHINGQYFDDPSPYPQPEFSAVESYNNEGIPKYVSTYKNKIMQELPTILKDTSTINIKPPIRSNFPNSEIRPSKSNQNYYGLRVESHVNNQNINVNVPPISFGLVHQGEDINAHIINHNGGHYSNPKILNLKKKPADKTEVVAGAYQYHYINTTSKYRPFNEQNINHKNKFGYNRGNNTIISDQFVDLRPPSQFQSPPRAPTRHNYHKHPLRIKTEINNIPNYMSPPPRNDPQIIQNQNFNARPSNKLEKIEINKNPVYVQNYEEIGDHKEDDIENDAGEVVQESNSRPLIPGQVPIEVLRAKTTTRHPTTTTRTSYIPHENEILSYKPNIKQPQPFINPIVRPENQQTNQINRKETTNLVLTTESYSSSQKNYLNTFVRRPQNIRTTVKPNKVTSLAIDGTKTFETNNKSIELQTEEPFITVTNSNKNVFNFNSQDIPFVRTSTRRPAINLHNYLLNTEGVIYNNSVKRPLNIEIMRPPPIKGIYNRNQEVATTTTNTPFYVPVPSEVITPPKINTNEVVGMSPPPFRSTEQVYKLPVSLEIDTPTSSTFKTTTEPTTSTNRPITSVPTKNKVANRRRNTTTNAPSTTSKKPFYWQRPVPPLDYQKITRNRTENIHRTSNTISSTVPSTIGYYEVNKSSNRLTDKEKRRNITLSTRLSYLNNKKTTTTTPDDYRLEATTKNTIIAQVTNYSLDGNITVYNSKDYNQKNNTIVETSFKIHGVKENNATNKLNINDINMLNDNRNISINIERNNDTVKNKNKLNEPKIQEQITESFVKDSDLVSEESSVPTNNTATDGYGANSDLSSNNKIKNISKEILLIPTGSVEMVELDIPSKIFPTPTLQSSKPSTHRRRIVTSIIKRPINRETILPTRYITHTKTSTVTITKTTVVKSLGGPPSTMTILVTKTEKSTIIDTVTEFHTLVKPTTVGTTVLLTPENSLYSSDATYGINPSKVNPVDIIPTIIVEGNTISEEEEDDDAFIIRDSDIPSEKSEELEHDNDSFLVVMTDKNKGSIIKIPKQKDDSRETQQRDEILSTNDVNRVLLGGVLIASPPSLETNLLSDRCNPECKATKNELCQKSAGFMRCVCRPGFARMFPDRPCKPTYTYTLRIPLERNGNDKIKFNSKLADNSSLEFTKLAIITHEALDRMVMQSDLRDIYHGVRVQRYQPIEQSNDEEGVINTFNLQLSDNTDEIRLEEVFKKYLRNNNYSLGGTELHASKEILNRLEADDFDECSTPQYHDCSEYAHCFNLLGTYTCSCKEGYADLSENMLYPGRVCSAELVGCEKCHYHGTCYSRGEENIICECFQWYAGENCQINLKVLLIALVTLGAILTMLLLICIVITCARKKPTNHLSNGMNFLPQRVPGPRRGSTMDRRAMIQDTSSESGNSENLPYVAKTKILKGALKKKQSDVENGEGSATYNDQKDRSLTVMIPRAKYHPAPPNQQYNANFEKRKNSIASSNEAKLLSYLDAGPSPSKGNSRKYSKNSDTFRDEPGSRKTSGALVSAGFEVSATVGVPNLGTGTLATTCGTEADRSENATLIQKISADLLSTADTQSQFNTLRKSIVDTDEDVENWLDIAPRIQTISEARSYDETTIHPPMKSFKNDYDSKSSHHHHDEADTMAERDLGSTFLLPHTHLYKPDRGSDISGFESL